METINFLELSKQIRACKICEADLPLGANPVFRANPAAKILIAGQAPGIKVHQSSLPFDDASGDRLRRWMGVSPEVFYDEKEIAIVPMGFCYPGKGKSGDLPPRKECVATWHQRLLQQMPNIQLTLTIGSYAQKYYLRKQQKNNLTETVRAWQNYLPQFIPLPHPSPRNNIWLKKNAWFELTVVPSLQQRVKSIVAF